VEPEPVRFELPEDPQNLSRVSKFFDGFIEHDKVHKVARCRWCGGNFVRYFHHWVCGRSECQERCAHHAVVKLDIIDGESPFLFLPLPFQVDITESPVKRLLVIGAAGISKSFGGRWDLYKCCRQIKGFRALLLRCTYDQLYKNHLQFMHEEARLLGDATFLNSTSQPKQQRFENGSAVYMGYCQHTADIGQHLGNEWDRIVFEEAVHFLPRAIAEISARDRGSSTAREAMYALGRETGDCRYLTNPGGQAAMYLDDFCISKKPDAEEYPHYDPQFYGAIYGSITDNPYLSADYKSSVLGGLESARYQQLAEGRTDIFPGQFFSTFNPRLHVRDSL
jgi:hypothetical protein